MSKKILILVLIASVLGTVVAVVWHYNRPPAAELATPAQGTVAQPASASAASQVESEPPGQTPASATYVGGASCAACHAVQFEQWQGSHHDLAMQEASAQDRKSTRLNSSHSSPSRMPSSA